MFQIVRCIVAFLLMSTTPAYADEWKSISDPKLLKELYNNKIHRGTFWAHSKFELNKIDTNWTLEYCQNGEGQLTFWGEKTSRLWEVTEDSHVCITSVNGRKCYIFQHHTGYTSLYRAGVAGADEMPWVFTVTDEESNYCDQR